MTRTCGVWLVNIPAAGTYHISTGGQVSGFIAPRLAFSHKSAYGWLVWVFVVVFVIGLLPGACALWWSLPSRRAKPPMSQAHTFSPGPVHAEEFKSATAQSPSAAVPTDEGVKLEQLETLAAMRNSGALTEAEFQTEKRRILEGLNGLWPPNPLQWPLATQSS